MLVGVETPVAVVMQHLAGATLQRLPGLPSSDRDLDRGDGARAQIDGAFQGVHVRVTFGERHGRGLSEEFRHPTCVDIPGSHGLVVELERRNKFGGSGHVGDVDLIHFGDAAFDARFWAEGAPRDVVRGILGPPIRARLVQLGVDALRIDTRGVRLALRGWPTDPHFVRAVVETAVMVATSIGGSSTSLAQHPEVLALHAGRERRRAAETRILLAILGAVLLVLVIVAVVGVLLWR